MNVSYNRTFYLWVFLIILPEFIYAQQACENADFETGTFQSWSGSTGNCCPSNINLPGFALGDQHMITSGAGTDLNTCNTISVVAPGSAYSARLGNQNVGAQAERLEYTFTVTPQSTMIIYKYAVVLQDPGHSPSEQPRFEAQLIDDTGAVVPCTYYLVVAADNLQGFQTCNDVRYLNWTTVGVNVSSYLGKTLTLQFTTGDCALGGHFGYAYVEASCAPFQLDARYCVDQGLINTVMSAPEGFQSYSWETNGQVIGTTSTIEISNPTDGQEVNCTITSANGCVAVLTAKISPSDVNIDYIPATACAGDTLKMDAVPTLVNATVDAYQWKSSDGFVSDSSSFVHVFSNPGTYTVSLGVLSDAGCRDSIQHTVQVYEVPQASFTSADTVFCTGHPVTFGSNSIINSGDPLSYLWILDGQDSSKVNPFVHTFTDTGTYVIELQVETDKGCYDDTTQLVTIHLSPPPPGLSSTTILCPGDTITIAALQQSFSSISWTGPAGFTSDQFVNTFPMQIANIGDYQAVLISDTNGCPSIAQTIAASIVYKYNFDDFIFPNVITPNDDQLNEVLNLHEYFQTCEQYHLIILNRWGNLVYEQTESSAPFHGIDKGGETLNEGVYFYKLECRQGTKSGYIQVIR